MKIQALAVIFVLIILPISIVLSEYVQVQMDTIKVQTQYDSQLVGATYDAVAAFQKNTVNSNYSDLTSSKMRDIEASANVFLNSVANNFKMAGNSKDAIKEYVPALVYTLYDGYYIYTPFYNNLLSGTDENNITVTDSSTYQNGERIFGLKPYIYYSKNYSDSVAGYDVVITYTLDNYITIQGKITDTNGEQKIINESGYIIDITGITDPNYDGDTYKGITIGNDIVEEYVGVGVDKDKKCQCVKINGTKYYYDGYDNEKGMRKIFYFSRNEKQELGKTTANEYYENYFKNDENNMAKEYYKNAYKFTDKVLNKYRLSDLKASDGNKLFDTNAKNVEYYNSKFNEERRQVIKESIEKNLSVAISNFNRVTEIVNNDFRMPKLQEDEWDKIINNVSVISFMQGVNMGTRPYNGYAIVTNNKNEESVGEESIYIVTKDDQYHRINDSDLTNGTYGAEKLLQGIFNMNFERKSIDILLDDGSVDKKEYFFPRKELACYNSIVNQSGLIPMTTDDGDPITVYQYLERIGNQRLSSLYYTALGRERQGLFKMGNNEWVNGSHNTQP